MSLSVNPQSPVTTPVAAPAPQGSQVPVEAKPAEGTKPSFRGAEAPAPAAPATNPIAPATTEAAPAPASAETGKKLNIVG